MILGLTGGIATGKSTVSNMFQDHGAFLIDADQIAREVVEPGTPGLRQVVQAFGEEVLYPGGRLNRAALGQIIFENPTKRHLLERILHPLIRDSLMKETKEALTSHEIVLWDIPLLIERKMMPLVDYVLLVYAPERVQLQRLMERDGFSEEESLQRIGAQMNIEKKRKYADLLIDNQGSLESTQRQVDHIWRDLTKKHLD